MMANQSRERWKGIEEIAGDESSKFMRTFQGIERDYSGQLGDISIVNDPEIALTKSSHAEDRTQYTIGTAYATDRVDDVHALAKMSFANFREAACFVVAAYQESSTKRPNAFASAEDLHAVFMAGVVEMGTKYHIEGREVDVIIGYLGVRSGVIAEVELSTILQQGKFAPDADGIEAAIAATPDGAFWEDRVDWRRQGQLPVEVIQAANSGLEAAMH